MMTLMRVVPLLALLNSGCSLLFNDVSAQDPDAGFGGAMDASVADASQVLDAGPTPLTECGGFSGLNIDMTAGSLGPDYDPDVFGEGLAFEVQNDGLTYYLGSIGSAYFGPASRILDKGGSLELKIEPMPAAGKLHIKLRPATRSSDYTDISIEQTLLRVNESVKDVYQLKAMQALSPEVSHWLRVHYSRMTVEVEYRTDDTDWSILASSSHGYDFAAAEGMIVQLVGHAIAQTNDVFVVSYVNEACVSP